MEKQDLILKWQKQFDHYDKLLKENKSETIEQLYRCSFETRQIQCFIDDLKSLQGDADRSLKDMNKFNLNSNVTIYPTTKGWTELHKITQEYYNLDVEKTTDWIKSRKTENNDAYGFKDQLHVIMNIYGAMFFNGNKYLITANIDLS